MERVTVTADLAARLGLLGDSAELCNEAGTTLGRFAPAVDLSKWVPLSPGISEEELEHRANSDEEGSPLAEVLARIEKAAYGREAKACC